MQPDGFVQSHMKIGEGFGGFTGDLAKAGNDSGPVVTTSPPTRSNRFRYITTR